MIKNLPRQMLWTDFKTIDRFYKIEPLNTQFHEVLKSIDTTPFIEKKDDTKVFNEVYYQMTRMAYERALPADLSKYEADIRVNMMLSYGVELVMSMLYFLMSLVDKNSRQFNSFLLLTIKERYRRCPYWKPFNARYTQLSKGKKQLMYDFKPRPVPVMELADKYVHWQEITRNYDGGAVLEVIGLWENQDDKVILANMILTSVNFKTPKQQNLYLDQINTVLKEHVFDKAKQSNESTEIENRIKELDSKVLILEREKIALQIKVNEQKGNIDKLNALLDKKKQNGTARKFTMVEMVNHCKGCVSWDEAKEIVSMLNKLLRGIGTKEDYDLLDSIEEEFKNRKNGDAVSGNKTCYGDNSNMVNLFLSGNVDYEQFFAALPDDIKDIWRKQLTKKDNG